MAGPIVETTLGRVRGRLVQGVQVFRGLRYGASTGGTNRFRPPQPLTPWTGLRDALENGPACPQLTRPESTDPFYSWYSAIDRMDEDCLVLNVFAPDGDGAKRPVMVWIHGGGWRDYSGGAPGFDGTDLARAEDVVVVCINHRLGVLGYLALNSSDEAFGDSANAGALDIVTALEWVRDNAAAFGGDPANVTVFGESGGASKIAALLSMRRAKGLFQKAILQSSASGLRNTSADDAGRLAAQLASALGLDRLDPAHLQSLPVQTLLDATRKVAGSFRGTIDGRSFDADPFGDTAPETAAGVPVLAGCTLTEATYYLRGDDRNFALDWAQVEARLARFFKSDPAQTRAILQAYRDANPTATASQIMILAASDFIFKRNTYRMAALQSAQAPVWAYHFEWTSPIEGGRMGAPHTCEIPFIFGTTDAAKGCLGDGPDLSPMTRIMQATWAAFARRGDPNNSALPRWPQFDPAVRRMMVLNTRPAVASDPGGEARKSLDGLGFFGPGHSIPALLAD